VAGRDQLLITGLYRSGTTYTDRLLDNLPTVSCASQPFPFLYLDVKRRFLRSRGLTVPVYPIGSGFHDELHRPAELREYLTTTEISPSLIQQTFRDMEGYSGALTSELAEVVEDIPAGTLGDVVCSMHSLLAERRAANATVVASKDILCEEFGPALNDAGIRVVILIRDPRAVVASTFGPSAVDWSGSPRPLLHTVRLWRKSVAYALQSGTDVRMLLFEELKRDPARALEQCLGSLGIDVEIDIPSTLRSADGGTWDANTSFPGETARDSFALSDAQLAYVEALAFPEMLKLGYAPITDVGTAERAFVSFRSEDDPGRAHPVFTPDFSVDAVQVSLERERLDRLRAGDVGVDTDAWFVLPGTGRTLADAIKNCGTSYAQRVPSVEPDDA
jgi:hypothetical protein